MWWLVRLAEASSTVPEFETPVRTIVDLVLIAAAAFIVAILAWRGAEIAGDHFEGIPRKIGAVAIGIGFIAACRVLAQRFIGSAIAQPLIGTAPAFWLEGSIDFVVMLGYYGLTSLPALLWWRRHRA